MVHGIFLQINVMKIEQTHGEKNNSNKNKDKDNQYKSYQAKVFKYETLNE